MAWQMSGRFHEFCNCKLLCPCLFDVTVQPDEGWCGSAFTFDVEQGRADGVDLSGVKAVLAVNIPGSFAQGNFTARLYIDEKASEEQRRTLEEIFTGKRGGPWEAVSPVFATWLPTTVTTIKVKWGDNPSITVGDIGKLVSEPRKDPSGKATKVEAAEALLGFQIGEFQPAKTTGSRWNDPDLRSFEGNSGFTGSFGWQA
jgi:hypothetical protein